MVFAPDGRCQHIPGQDQIPDTARVVTYPVHEQYGLIWIWMGQNDLANRELIPAIPWASLDGWTASPGYTHIAADYRLLTDNLLDLSHETYIHGSTIGNSPEETIAAYPVKVSVDDGRVVSARRDMPNIAPPPMFAMLNQSSARIDRWQTAIWIAPSLNITDGGVRPARDESGETSSARVLHLLTPESDRSTHYFWAFCRNFRQQDDKLTEAITQAHRRTFDEDKHMLELQQLSLEQTGLAVPKVALRVDEAPLRARRILNQLIKHEAASPNYVLPKISRIFQTEPALHGEKANVKA